MSYKLVYFNVRGKTECLRYIFALAGQEYEDKRIELVPGNPTYSDEWLQYKPTTLWGTVPELEYNDLRLCQTPAIARFLGAQFGLAGKTPFQTAQVDMIISCLEDIFSTIGFINRQPREKRSDAAKEKEPKFQDWISHLNKFLVSNKGGEGWFIGDSVTIADAYAYSLSPFVGYLYPKLLDNYQELKALFSRFEQLPEIAAWIEKRPQTLY